MAAGQAAAAWLIVIDAIDADTAHFYERHGFVRAPEHPLRLHRRMTGPIKDLVQAGPASPVA